MKHNKIIWLLVSGILICSITGCQTTAATTSPAPTSNPTEPQQVPPTEGSYPASSSQANPTAGSYPASSSQTITAVPYPSPSGNLAPTVSAYPSPQEGVTTISWAQAEQLILAGNVTSIVQTQSLDVTLTLKTGQIYKTTAPAADAAQKAITTCGEPCKNLTVTNQ